MTPSVLHDRLGIAPDLHVTKCVIVFGQPEVLVVVEDWTVNALGTGGGEIRVRRLRHDGKGWGGGDSAHVHSAKRSTPGSGGSEGMWAKSCLYKEVW